MTNEEKAFTAWWKEWDENVFEPWVSKPPASVIARAFERQYRATLARPSDKSHP